MRWRLLRQKSPRNDRGRGYRKRVLDTRRLRFRFLSAILLAMTSFHSSPSQPKRFRWALIALALLVGLMLTTTAMGAASADRRASSVGNRGSDAVFPFAYSPLVAQMIAEVQQSDVYNFTGCLSGALAPPTCSLPSQMKTRNTYSTAYISQATQYVYEFMQARGLAVSFYDWHDSAENVSGRNVIGVLTGTTRPNEIVLITAHLDDMPEGNLAPGADDNASGSVGVMIAAARLASRRFERTVRFIFFTGEEQDLCGSWAYAQDRSAKKENIVAVLNMDMIGWDGNKDGMVFLETRYATSTGYASDSAIANVFIQVVNTYGLRSALDPYIDACNDDEVDSWSFWYVGYPSVTAIEDFDHEELNPYYHTVGDTLATLNMPFFTNHVKAVVGTAAHLATPIPTGNNRNFLPLILKQVFIGNKTTSLLFTPTEVACQPSSQCPSLIPSKPVRSICSR